MNNNKHSFWSFLGYILGFLFLFLIIRKFYKADIENKKLIDFLIISCLIIFLVYLFDSFF